MNKPHKHAEVIKAWADGATIESRVHGGNWEVAESPGWYANREYRIKPQPKENIILFTVLPTFVDRQANVRQVEFIYSGETGELISSRVLL